MKVLQVNCVFPLGSTGKIVNEIHRELLERKEESIVCYGRGTTVRQDNVHKVSTEIYSKFNNVYSRFSGLMYGGCYFSTQYLISIIKKEKPDIVHLHCINGYFVNIYRLVEWLKKKNIKTVLTMHAEFMYTANCSHAYECEQWKYECTKCPRLKAATKSLLFDRTKTSYRLMKKAFENFDYAVVASVSPWVQKRAMQSPILKELKHRVVLNGVNTDVFHYVEDKKLKEQSYIFHVTAHFTTEKNHPKGGWAIVELAKRMKDTLFYVASSRSEIKENLPSNIILLGHIKNQEDLARYYSNATLTVITSQRETFSMPVAESLCCGTPVVGFEAGAPEMIAINEYSDFVEYGNIDLLTQVVNQHLKDDIEKTQIEDKAKKHYDNKIMVQSYLDIYGGLL